MSMYIHRDQNPLDDSYYSIQETNLNNWNPISSFNALKEKKRKRIINRVLLILFGPTRPHTETYPANSLFLTNALSLSLSVSLSLIIWKQSVKHIKQSWREPKWFRSSGYTFEIPNILRTDHDVYCSFDNK